VARAVTRCPNCGQPVSQFAAGCAICGEDLVAARRRKQERHRALSPLRLGRLEWLPQVTAGEALFGAALVLIAFFVPLVGLILAAAVAYFAHRNDETVVRNLALAAVAVALVVVLLVSFVPATWDELLPWVNLSGPFAD
jgi:positive regulator of sigma E activity